MDDSLDDFFAKKDKSNKKKGRSKAKIVAADFLPAASTPTPPNETNDFADQVTDQMAEARIGDAPPEPVKEKKKSKKKRDKDGGDGGSRKDDDEWNEVKDEVDYSGLRIATKNIAKEAEEEAAENAARLEPEYDEDGQIIEKTEGAVWKLPMNPDPAPDAETATPAPAPIITEMPNVSEGRYVPPSRRAGAAGASELEPLNMKKTFRRRTAPNVNSQEDFPTLGAAPPPVDYDVSKFEKVRGGSSSQQNPSRAESSRVETSNMYSALDRR